MKKFVIITLIVILSLLLLAVGAIAVALNFIFTPSKLTPIVERIANENLNARLSLSSVELTFFSTFPNFALSIDNAALLSPTRDTTLQNDTIISLKRVDIVVNPIALLKNNQIIVHQINMDTPRIYAAITAAGAKNWNITKTDTTTTAASGSTIDQSLAISLSNISIKNGNIIFDDRQADIYTITKDVTMTLRGDISAQAADLDLKLSFNDALLWQHGELILKNIDLSTTAILAVDTTTKKVLIRQSGIELNKIKFNIDGSVTRDSVDMKVALLAPSIATVMELLPLSKKAAKLNSTGSVEFSGTIRGAYRNKSVPVVDARILVKNATAHYQGFKYGVDKLDISAAAHLDLSRRSDSYIHIDRFAFNGASTTVDFAGKITGLLSNPKLKFETKSQLDLTKLASTFPLKEGTEIGGTLTIEGSGEISQKQITDQAYATIQAAAQIKMEQVKFVVADTVDSRFSGLNIALSSSKEGLLQLKGNIRDMEFKTKRTSLALSTVDVAAAGVKDSPDSSSYLGGSISYGGLSASLLSDSVKVNSSRSTVAFELNKTARLRCSTDSLWMQALDNKASMSKAGINILVDKRNYNGTVSFDQLRVATPQFPLKMSMPTTKITVDNHHITLNQAVFNIGTSNVRLTGVIDDLLKSARGLKPLTMRVDVSSENINLTEIIHTLNSMDPQVSKQDTTTNLDLFIVPRGIDFELNTDLARVEFGRLILDKTHGKVTVRDGIARLNNLSIDALGAQIATTLVYDCSADSLAKVGMILASRSIDVHSVIELIPSLDTLMPMLNSFEGKVNFTLTADTKFNRAYTINPKDIRATAAFSGENLTLLDGQTFTEISKMLMFKKQARNVVDSVSVQMAVENGAVEIFPFLIQIDRYRAAIGGEHFMDNKFNYHISILKSPIPFKFGINITGSLEKMKVGIGKTKYKFMNEPSAVRSINPQYIELGKQISDAIHKL